MWQKLYLIWTWSLALLLSKQFCCFSYLHMSSLKILFCTIIVRYSDFNRHFAAASYIFDDEDNGFLPTNNDNLFINYNYVFTPNQAPQLTLNPVPFSLGFEALWTVYPKISIGKDNSFCSFNCWANDIFQIHYLVMAKYCNLYFIYI